MKPKLIISIVSVPVCFLIGIYLGQVGWFLAAGWALLCAFETLKIVALKSHFDTMYQIVLDSKRVDQRNVGQGNSGG